MTNQNQIVRNVVLTDLPRNVVTTKDLMSGGDKAYRDEVRAVCAKYKTSQLYFDLNSYDLKPMTYGEIEASRKLDDEKIVVTDDMLPDLFFEL